MRVFILFLLVFSCQPQNIVVSIGEKIESAPPVSGNLNPGKTCVEGQRLGLWLDTDNDEVEDKYQGSFVAYSGSETAKKNYNYYSASAHPIVGPNPSGFKSTVFFYEGSDGIHLFFFHNVDAGGSEYNEVQWKMAVSDNNMEDDVVLSDDNAELKVEERNDNESITRYDASFRYWKNTDGGVIGPLVGDDYKIVVRNVGAGDISDSKFYSADGEDLSLENDNGDLSSFIIKFESYESCN